MLDGGGQRDAGDSGITPPNGDGGCGLRTCRTANAECGAIGDGCGGILQCGDCALGACGGGGVPFKCGFGGNSNLDGGSDAGVCVPKSCAELNANCGPILNGCGAILECGECDAGSCGGGGVHYQCGDGLTDGGSCVNLCAEQGQCDAGATIQGTVFAATDPDAGFGSPDPLPNALVYIPNGTVEPFTHGVTCDVCGAPASGDPLVTAMSMGDGGFLLTNVPTGNDIPLVIQLGRWRRQITIPTVSCGTNTLTPEQTRLPRNQNEGDIPRIAMVTGKVDAVECVLRKMGIDDSEFTTPDTGGRVNIYVSDDDAGDPIGGSSDPTGNAPPESALTGSLDTLENYDLVMFACVGGEHPQLAGSQQNLIDYTSAGGRVYATHFSYVWLFDDQPFEDTATWATDLDTQDDNTEDVTIDTSFPKGQEMSDWLLNVGASTVPGTIPLGYLRNDFTGVNLPSENWLSFQPADWTSVCSSGGTCADTCHNKCCPAGCVDAGIDAGPAWPIHYTFNTPVDAGTQCGRVVYSDFHVENNGGSNGTLFPSECTNGPMTAQEKVLEFMLFDLSSCVVQNADDGGAVCAPENCRQQGYSCGQAGDGCGNIIQCGECDAGTCGGGGAPGVCGSSPCTPLTCTEDGFDCGATGNGCGGVLECGVCDAGTCGGNFSANVCGSIELH